MSRGPLFYASAFRITEGGTRFDHRNAEAGGVADDESGVGSTLQIVPRQVFVYDH